jgi:hypothetical protein
MQYVIVKSSDSIDPGTLLRIGKDIRSTTKSLIPKGTIVEVMEVDGRDIIAESPDGETILINDRFPYKVI